MSKVIKDELLSIKGEKEFLTAEEVVKWAKAHKGTSLHNAFDWNLKTAAHKHWLHTARQLIAVHVVYADGQRQLISLSIDRTSQGGYRDVHDVVNTPTLHEVLLADALRELNRIEVKYEKLQALKPVWQAAERVRRRGKKVVAQPRATA